MTRRMDRLFAAIAAVIILIFAVNPLLHTNEVQAKAKLSKPTIKVSQITDSTVTIKWKKIAYAKNYKVYRYNDDSGEYEKIKTVNGVTFTDKNLDSDTKYFYKVQAISGNKKRSNSSVSKAISAITKFQAAENQTQKPDVGEVDESAYLVISQTDISLKEGDSAKINATIIPANSAYKSVSEWSSSDSSVASVENGTIKANRSGTATITAKLPNGAKASCEVTVKSPYPGTMTITINGTTYQYYAKIGIDTSASEIGVLFYREDELNVQRRLNDVFLYFPRKAQTGLNYTDNGDGKLFALDRNGKTYLLNTSFANYGESVCLQTLGYYVKYASITLAQWDGSGGTCKGTLNAQFELRSGDLVNVDGEFELEIKGF